MIAILSHSFFSRVSRNICGWTQKQNFEFCIFLLVLIVAIIIRSLGLNLDYWADEAWWATRLASENIYVSLRPLGYVALSKLLYSLSEVPLALRAHSFIPGIGTVVIIFLLAKHLFKSSYAVLIITLICALHPKLVAFSKEFKPYSLEVFMHAAFIYWLVSTPKHKLLSTKNAIFSVLSVLFCYNLAFSYPVMLFVVREKLVSLYQQSTKYHLPAALSLVGLSVVFYIIFEPLIDGIESRRVFFGEKYDTFPINLETAEIVAWYAQKTFGLILMASGIETHNGFISKLATGVFILLFITGFYAAIKTRRTLIVVAYATNTLALIMLNITGIWPYGEFRANLFTIPYILVITGMGIDYCISKSHIRWLAIICSIALVTPSATRDLTRYKFKLTQDWVASPQLIDTLKYIENSITTSDQFSENIILCDWHSWRPLHFHLTTSDRARLLLPNTIEKVTLIRPPASAESMLEDRLSRILLRAKTEQRDIRVWLIVTKNDHSSIIDTYMVKDHLVDFKEYGVTSKKYHARLHTLYFEYKPSR